LVGLPIKLANGTIAPVPSRALVLLPSLPVVKTTRLLKVPSWPGVKLRTRLVEPKPARLKGVPEMMAKGPPFTTAAPLLSAAPPKLVKMKLAWTLDPKATVPKFTADGKTASCAGVNPVPVIELVLLPPLLIKTTALLKFAALAGLKLTVTEPDC